MKAFYSISELARLSGIDRDKIVEILQSLGITYTVPKVNGSKAFIATSQLRAKWREFYETIEESEDDHPELKDYRYQDPDFIED